VEAILLLRRKCQLTPGAVIQFERNALFLKTGNGSRTDIRKPHHEGGVRNIPQLNQGARLIPKQGVNPPDCLTIDAYAIPNRVFVKCFASCVYF
jgi:hypothetical protein